VLGLGRNATAADIQTAYRDLARKYHPDLNSEDASAKEKFQAVQHAYEVLSDPEKRQHYDQFGSEFPSAAGHGPQSYTWQQRPGGEAGFEDIDLSQIFGDFGERGAGGFGDVIRQFTRGGQRRRRARPGNDLSHELKVPFRTAIEGGEARISVRREGGQGETITVKIPAGIEDGKRIRLRGQGAPSPSGGPSGDLLIAVRVEKHPSFQRRGDDLDVRVPVTLAEAAAGCKVDVPTPQGTIAVKVPPCTSSGTKLRVKGHGVPRVGGKTGDLYAEIMIVMPAQLTEQQVAWLKDLNGTTANPRAKLKW
jgi:DnaJ-class molecular chaperone